MTSEQIINQVKDYQMQGLRVFATSSFQTHSIVMLHLISRADTNIPIYFLNTGYLFPETHTYKDQITQLLGLQIISLRSATPISQQKDALGHLLFNSDPDYCCFLNKIQPLESILASHDIWINGIRGDQNENRKNLNREEKSLFGTTRFHPLIEWDARMIEQYIKEHKLPRHPLEDKGYLSVGCEPCTRKIDLQLMADPRLARWFGMSKTECGLHTDLIENK